MISPLLRDRLPAEDDPDLIFAAPWEAKAFAIIVKLAQDGHFSWADWVACFSREVAAATAAAERGEPAPSYYEQWLTAAETLLVERRLTSREQLLAKRFAVGAAGTMRVMR